MRRSPPVLEFRDVTVIQGDENKKVLDRFSLTLRADENVAILGANGAGKSSLIKTITREYYPIADGRSVCKVWGRDRWKLFELRELLGIVSNDLQAACSRDVPGFETVLSGFFGSIGLHQGQRVTVPMKRKAAKILEFLEIGHLRDRKMSVMSSGEARRFLIARALIHDPKALILDEPTNSLDLRSTHYFKEMLRKIARSGIRIVLVTQHLPDIIPEIARVVLMKNGRVLEDGPKETMLTRRHISRLFDLPIGIREKGGYYYALG